MSQGSQIHQLFERFPDASPEDVADSIWLVALGLIREPRVATRPSADASQRSGIKDPGASPNSPSPTEAREPAAHQELQGSSQSSQTSSKDQATDSARGDLLARANEAQPQIAGSTTPRTAGEVLHVPGGSPLPGAAQIGRALRPFRRRVPSRHLQTLDIDATVRQIASREIWYPVLRPSRARWFEIALVAEWSNSMSLWTDTVRAFRRVLERLGGFRDVRLWWVEKPAGSSVVLRSKPGSAPRSPRELVAPDGRRIILFATDCLSNGWRDEAFHPLLNELGRRQPVAILQMLPRTWWGRTALAQADPVFIGSKCPGTPNQALSHEPADPLALALANSRLSDATRGPQRQVPIPILTSEPEFVAEWARLVCNGLKPSLPGFTFAIAPPPDSGPDNLDSTVADNSTAGAATDNPPTPTAEQRWRRFTALASPTAMRLARLLAATHLRLPIVRLVQTALLPDSDQTHLAEVFLGGIVRRVSPPDVTDPDRVQYAFHDGVAERLRTNTPLDQMLDVHALVSKYIENRYGASLHLEAILRTGEAPKDGADFEERSEFATVTADVLRRFGARYADAASKIAPKTRRAAGETTTTATTQAASTKDARSPDPSSVFADELREDLRKFLRQHDIYQRFKREDNDADGLFQPQPSKFQWELLWAELWRASTSDDERWAKVLELVRIAASARRVVVSLITGDVVEDIFQHPEDSTFTPSPKPLVGKLLEAATQSTATWQGLRKVQTTLAIAIPNTTADAVGPAGLLQMERASNRAFSPSLMDWLRQLAGSLATRLPATAPRRPQTGQNFRPRLSSLFSALEGREFPDRALVWVRATFRFLQTIPSWDESSEQLSEARQYVELSESAILATSTQRILAARSEGLISKVGGILASAELGDHDPNGNGWAATALVLAAAAVVSATDRRVENELGPLLLEFLTARLEDGVLSTNWLVALESDMDSGNNRSNPSELA
jgi:hypothetical protein